jgi:hypothetical protein
MTAPPKPSQEFYPDWDTLQPFYERIAELEKELAKPEQESFKPDWANYRQGLADGAAQPEQEPVAWAVLRPDGRVKLLSHQIGVEVDLKWTPLYVAPPRKEWERP